MKKGLIVGGVILGILLVVGFSFVSWGVGKYNAFTKMGQGISAQWANVGNAYQRRADLIPNLAETVKGYADHESGTFAQVAEARAKAGQIQIDPSKMTPEMLSKYQAVQGELSQAMSRLMVVIERYPKLKAIRSFTTLQNQLEGTENRIAVERRRYNELVLGYNAAIKMFPGNIIAGMYGFGERPFFKAEEGTERAPKVDFSKKK